MIVCRDVVLILVLGVLLCSIPAVAECEPIEGLEGLVRPGQVLLLGELHGTLESPAFAVDVACHAVATGVDVVVAIELTPAISGDVARFFESPKEPGDWEALLTGSVWQRSYQDGRNSRAMADLIVEVARMNRAGKNTGIVLFDAQPAGGGQAREQAMASNLSSSIERSPEAMHIVLAGNLHTRVSKGNGRSPDYEPMGFLLSRKVGRERVTALDVSHAGGSAWICAPDCGVAQIGARGSRERWTIEIDDATRPAGHDGWYGVGAIVASPPAVGEFETKPAPPEPAALPRSSDSADEFPEQTAEMLDPFQGSWVAFQYGSRAWTIEIVEQRFRGVLGPDDWYEGQIRLDPGSDPAQIDFVIEDCRCDYRGMTSKAIYRLEAESIRLAAPTPGSARPSVFSESDGRMVELKRAIEESP